jgi:ABC-type multidrug transport system permease subunit
MRYHPLKELLLARMREFWREPETLFWVYGFPLLLTLGLGIAFRNRPVDQIFVDVQEPPPAAQVVAALKHQSVFVVEVHSPTQCRERLRLGKSSLVVVPGNPCTYLFDPTRPESVLARERVDDALQRAAGRKDPVTTRDQIVEEPGARYIDFLVPGLLGANLLGSGLWGVGYVVVDMRVKKLLKRFIATPMKRSDFLWALVGGRLIFLIPELVVILGAGVLMFRIPIRGSAGSIILVALCGTFAFSGLGLLTACRAQHLETASGLMNLLQLPMWILSGIFFSPDRFPSFLQPLVQALPLTQLNYALRAVILEGAALASQGWRLGVLLLWGGLSFLFALRFFRWN